MAEVVLRTEGLGKRYRLGGRQASYRTFREFLTGLPGAFRVRGGAAARATDWLWALHDASFDVREGEVVGIIGRNGSGKTTLLKLISRIAEPTAGCIAVHGRVSSLLEVGTGFHPELSGRENIFLNGSIMGMRKSEIDRQFDQIVAFAEIERFLDTPVKRYSSGMYMRLAFAVAAHLEPEILLVDEVLAVGDAAFQKKCLGKMGDAARSGRTVLLVSHNLAVVEHLCSRAIVLVGGGIAYDGGVAAAVRAYLAQVSQTGASGELTTAAASMIVRVFAADGRETDVVQAGMPATFVLEVAPRSPIVRAGIGIGIVTPAGERVLTFHSHFQCPGSWPVRERCTCRIEWPQNFLCPGPYRLVAAIYDGAQLIASWDDAGCLTVIPSDFFGTGRHPDPTNQGHVMARSRWEVTADGVGVPCQP